MPSLYKTLLDSASNYAQYVLILLLDSILNIILSRHLSIDHYANISLALRLINILSFSILLGTSDSSAKSFRDIIIKRRKEEIGRYISWNLNYISKPLISSIIVAFILFFTLDPLNLFSWGYDEFYIEFLPFIFLTAPFLALIRLYASFIRCYKKFNVSRFIEGMAFSILTIIFLLIDYKIYHVDPTNEFITVRVLFRSYLLVSLISTLYIAIYLPEIFSKIKDRIHQKQIRYTWICDAKLHAKNLLLFNLNSNISVILVGVFAYNTNSLAFFTVALLISQFISLVPSAIFVDFIPDINDAMKTSQTLKKFGSQWRQCSTLNFICTCLIAFILFYFSEQILSIFGKDFTTNDAVMMLNIVLFGQTLRCLFGYNQLLLCFTDLINKLTKIDLISFFMQLLLSILLFTKFGIQGIALGFSISMVLNELIVLYTTKKHIPFNLYFTKKKIFIR